MMCRDPRRLHSTQFTLDTTGTVVDFQLSLVRCLPAFDVLESGVDLVGTNVQTVHSDIVQESATEGRRSKSLKFSPVTALGPKLQLARSSRQIPVSSRDKLKVFLTANSLTTSAQAFKR